MWGSTTVSKPRALGRWSGHHTARVGSGGPLPEAASTPGGSAASAAEAHCRWSAGRPGSSCPQRDCRPSGNFPSGPRSPVWGAAKNAPLSLRASASSFCRQETTWPWLGPHRPQGPVDGLRRLKQTAEGAQCPHVLLRLCQASGGEEEDGGMGWWCRRGGGRGRGYENRTEAPGLFSSQIVGDLEHCLSIGVSGGRSRLPQGVLWKGGSPQSQGWALGPWAPDWASVAGLLLHSGDTGRRGAGRKLRSWTRGSMCCAWKRRWPPLSAPPGTWRALTQPSACSHGLLHLP